jgi:periplasmic protein TonB
MGYQALLFSPDEKLARIVSQVFIELDFAIEPAHEPFGAVKRLMAHHYDAIVVDCNDEQNASLIFKSARNSSLNQSSLAIAVVEGQAGVAKAYRIGANLVLTKPINVEQAKGTLRVARGLLRKHSESTGSSASEAVPAPAAPVPAFNRAPSRGAAAMTPPASRPEFPGIAALPAAIREVLPQELPAGFPAGAPAGAPAMSAPAKVEDKPGLPTPPALNRITMAPEPTAPALPPAPSRVVSKGAAKNEIAKNEAANSVSASILAEDTNSALMSAGSAAAPAPAKKVTAPPAKENKTVEFEPLNAAPYAPSQTAPMSDSVSSIDAPTFAALGDENSDDSGGSKKILMVAAIVIALAAFGYLGYGKLAKSSTATTVPQSVITPQGSGAQDSAPPAPAVLPMSSPKVIAPPITIDRASATPQSSAPKTAKAASPEMSSPDADRPSAIRIAIDPELDTKKPNSTALLVRSNPTGTKTLVQDAAPPLANPPAMASANDSALSGLMSSASPNLPRPVLATARVSQGVSQGLLIKRVQPKYPPAALAVHAQGSVQIEATISKEGNVTNLHVLKGDAVLARAALDAVRQWRYKPYYLDGEPVEMQTQITITFKAD